MKKLFLLILTLAIFGAQSAHAADPEKGRVIYDRLCWWCHGQDGEGDGPAAAYLNPPPRDFTMGLYKWKSTPHDEIMPAEADYIAAIAGPEGRASIPGWDGLSGTSMPGWSGVLSDGQMRDVTQYVKEMAGMEAPQASSVIFDPGAGPTAEVLAEGKKLFEDRCAECHGLRGRGDAEKGLKDDWGARTWPRNLTKGWSFRAGSGAKAVYERITVGIPGTQMPSFADPASKKVMTEEERRAVAYYTASLDEPYKKPSADTVIKAARMDGVLPGPRSSGWEKAEHTSLYLFPQIVATERLFTPSLDSVTIKALYNDRSIAIYMEWDDPTESVPGDEKAEDIAGAVVYPDMAAVQVPAEYEAGGRAPYFGMGDEKGPVDIWSWKLGEGASLIKARGVANIDRKEASDAGISAEGYYKDGTWRVVFTRPLASAGKGGLSFTEGVFTPIAFAAWDGSNGEKGSKHSMTGWASVRLEPAPKAGLYIWPAAVAVIFLVAEMLWAASARRGMRGE